MTFLITFTAAGWDFVGEAKNGLHEIWQMPEGGGYPILSTFGSYVPPELSGEGTPESPYLISNAAELSSIRHIDPNVHYRLTQNIDLSGTIWSVPVIDEVAGVLDGNGFAISNLKIVCDDECGLIKVIQDSGHISNLGIVDANVVGMGWSTGILAGSNNGRVTRCYSTGSVSGGNNVGGLLGGNDGEVMMCYSTSSVSGNSGVGGLVGDNGGEVINCHSAGSVSGICRVGGLVGDNGGEVIYCYSTASVSVSGTCLAVGGLVGDPYTMQETQGIVNSFWDAELCGLFECTHRVGLTTAQMQTKRTFVYAGWDFVGESVNGTDDIWDICEGLSYPRLRWQIPSADLTCPYGITMLDFSILALAWQSTPTVTNWDPECDLDGDEHIGAGDLAIACEQWLEGI